MVSAPIRPTVGSIYDQSDTMGGYGNGADHEGTIVMDTMVLGLHLVAPPPLVARLARLVARSARLVAS